MASSGASCAGSRWARELTVHPAVDAPASARETSDPFIGTIVADRYEILGLLSSGGMGRVYRAVQRMLDRVVAIKIIDPRATSPAMTAELTVALPDGGARRRAASTIRTSSACSISGARLLRKTRRSSLP